MDSGAAKIQSPDVLRRFRHVFIKFDSDSRQGLAGILGDLPRTIDWLQREQQSYWKLQLKKRETKLEEARRAYVRVRYDESYLGRNSAVDEKKAMERALRAKEEAEAKIELLKRWAQTLEREGGKLVQPCQVYASLLDTQSPRALNRMDRMIESLEAYLRLSGPALPDAASE